MKSKIRVLLVDSDKESLSSIEKYFSNHAVIKVVKSISNGNETIKFIKDFKDSFDIILLDLLLPEKDGISILSEMKKSNIDKRVIVLTGYNSLDMIKQVSLFNVNYFMLKPFDLKDLEYQIINLKSSKYDFVDNNKNCNTILRLYFIH